MNPILEVEINSKKDEELSENLKEKSSDDNKLSVSLEEKDRKSYIKNGNHKSKDSYNDDNNEAYNYNDNNLYW